MRLVSNVRNQEPVKPNQCSSRQPYRSKLWLMIGGLATIALGIYSALYYQHSGFTASLDGLCPLKAPNGPLCPATPVFTLNQTAINALGWQQPLHSFHRVCTQETTWERVSQNFKRTLDDTFQAMVFHGVISYELRQRLWSSFPDDYPFVELSKPPYKTVDYLPGGCSAVS